MTEVHVNLDRFAPTGGTEPVGLAEQRWAATRILHEAAKSIVPEPVTFTLNAGEGTVPIQPTGAGWAYRVDTYLAGRQITEYVLVPDAPAAEYSTLVRVNPRTLVPNPVATAWLVVVDDLIDIAINLEAADRDMAIATAVASLVDAAPGALDTLNELAAALGDNPNFATTVTDALAAKATTASQLLAAARAPETIIVGPITRNSDGAATSADIEWPDGTPGTYTALVLSAAFPGATDSYQITHPTAPAAIYTQPPLTRDAAGAVTDLPEIVVT